ncbi:hypothetical protein CEP54_016101 [Fusarium duplospermum]|uniref:PD-(D/E)XK nuclease-like domain-containing protein n=1 Tax=Fusarium duplospermum TaxID=1325734 RepID=A0A428NIC9_9HYPO|nr:hypothetical protein CEP54_016101 [Fusarium duplospermum]
MHVDAVRAWIETIETASALPHPAFAVQKSAEINECKVKRRFGDMPSPSKRPRREEDDGDVFGDTDATPTQPQRSGATDNTGSDACRSPAPSFSLEMRSSTPTSAPSSYGNVLANVPHIPAPGMAKDQKSQPSRPSASSRRRQSQRQSPERAGSKSPSKRYRRMADLSALSRPVMFEKVMDMKAKLPTDVHDLYDALAMASRGEEVLPAALADVPGVSRKDFRPYMWREPVEVKSTVTSDAAGTASKPWNRSVAERHGRILEIIEESNESGRWHRAEPAWNSDVHKPLLKELASSSSVRVENVTAAQIVSAFRPSFKVQDSEDVPSTPTGSSFSDTGSMISVSESNASRSWKKVGNSIHKMVDFALVLTPDKDLEALIDPIANSSPKATINHTVYFALKTRPSPVFIETKTASGNIESANVQLGIWIAAWHERMRSLMGPGSMERVIPVPVIQVVDGVWTLMFAVDGEDNKIHIFDQDMRIGNSGTILGMYQLQAALSAISAWIEGDFKMWITRILRTAST